MYCNCTKHLLHYLFTILQFWEAREDELTKLTFQASSIVLGVTTDLIPNQWTIQKNRLYQKGDGLQNTTWFAGCSQLGGPCPLSSSLHH